MEKICSLVTKAPNALSVCLLVLLIGSATMVHAQEKVQAGGYFMTIVPRGEFSQNVTNNGYGGGGQFVIRIGQSPILLGGDIGGVTYGSVSRREPFSTTIPNVGLRV